MLVFTCSQSLRLTGKPADQQSGPSHSRLLGIQEGEAALATASASTMPVHTHAEDMHAHIYAHRHTYILWTVLATILVL